MPSIVPSKNSAFRLLRPLPEPTMEKPIVAPPTNPHGFAWRAYTESHIRTSLCSDLQKRNVLLGVLQQINDRLATFKVLNNISKYKEYITLLQQKEMIEKKLHALRHKFEIHKDYQLYTKFVH